MVRSSGSRVRAWVGAAAVPVLGLGAGCSLEVPVLTACEAADGVQPVCGFQNPEDLAALPGGNWLAVSQMPGLGSAHGVSGKLTAWRPLADRRHPLFPSEGTGENTAAESERGWGDPSCDQPPDVSLFAPHGIDTVTLKSGQNLLAVVNHGGREAVELFEFDWAADGPRVQWRGCVVLPPEIWPNDVALLQNGELIVSNMISGISGVGAIVGGVQMLLGFDTGYVLAWKPETGWEEIEGTRGSAPNGVAITPDGKELYFAEWGRERLVRVLLDAEDSSRRRTVDLPHHPDNLSWTRDGQLLAAGQVGDLSQLLACGQVEDGTCAVAFSVVRIDPSTMRTEVILDHPGTATGGVSSALVVGDELFVGTFNGDRVGRAPYAP